MDKVDLQELLAGELAADLRMDGRAHGRYLQVMDRAFLSEFLAGDPAASTRVMDQNTASHVPTPQQYAAPK